MGKENGENQPKMGKEIGGKSTKCSSSILLLNASSSFLQTKLRNKVLFEIVAKQAWVWLIPMMLWGSWLLLK